MKYIQVSLPLYLFLLFSTLGFWTTRVVSVFFGGADGADLGFAVEKAVGKATGKNNSSILLDSTSALVITAEKTSPTASAPSKEKPSTRQKGTSIKLRGELSKIQRYGIKPEQIWDQLLVEGQAVNQQQQQKQQLGIAIEVGMHRAWQCRQAAERGFHAHCFEPSPLSYQRVMDGLERYRQNVTLMEHIHIYNAAVGSKSGGTISFLNSGSTGAHVVTNITADMDVVEVPLMKLDDVVEKVNTDVYIAKIDTQGFEPDIFEGLAKSIKSQKVKYILLEYWPRGMDTMVGAKHEERCAVSVKLLENLASAGYTLYQLGLAYHPGEPFGDGSHNHLRAGQPFDDLHTNCMWFYELEEKMPFAYHHGYWSDIFAVAPGSPLPDNPLTAFGTILKNLTLS